MGQWHHGDRRREAPKQRAFSRPASQLFFDRLSFNLIGTALKSSSMDWIQPFIIIKQYAGVNQKPRSGVKHVLLTAGRSQEFSVAYFPRVLAVGFPKYRRSEVLVLIDRFSDAKRINVPSPYRDFTDVSDEEVEKIDQHMWTECP
ncbi:hypothetical protein L1049_012111 [Liquidambar formosana]|uniref:Uncharacterized protein n=1 Tax=Liquidambar formosana TaxID=63359 RepID=A0AAP0RSK1_LIQFO